MFIKLEIIPSQNAFRREYSNTQKKEIKVQLHCEIVIQTQFIRRIVNRDEIHRKGYYKTGTSYSDYIPDHIKSAIIYEDVPGHTVVYFLEVEFEELVKKITGESDLTKFKFISKPR